MKKDTNIKPILYTMPISELQERLNLTFGETMRILFSKKKRHNCSMEIAKFDLNCKILEELQRLVEKNENEGLILLKTTLYGIVSDINEILNNKVAPKLSLQTYEEKNRQMELLYEEKQLIMENEFHEKNNSECIVDLIEYAFEKGVPYVGLFNHEKNLDFQKISEAVKKVPFKTYYMFSGNLLDYDEYIPFEVFADYQFSGIVISDYCSTEEIENLLNEYFKQKSLFDVHIFLV